jgi:acetoin utilization protein AcuC
MLPNFYYHPRMMSYDFGPRHPLKPERLRRTIELLQRYGLEPIDPGPGGQKYAMRVHAAEYVQAVEQLSGPGGSSEVDGYEFGFSAGDNPSFKGMFEASLAYLSGSARAAESVRDGAALAYGIAGGLHHARKAQAAGFCIFNDCAVAIDILLERFEKVAYVDIDVHHSEGVQWLWQHDPRVLVCNIHQDGRTLFPGTGFPDDRGEHFTIINMPVAPGTSGDVWLWAFEHAILPALERFDPQAIVLQMGTDSHWLDPLARVENSAQEWLAAVEGVQKLGKPIVALGGGGYNLTTVPRMWAAACLTLAGLEFENAIPADLAEAWGTPTFFDPEPLEPRGCGRLHAEQVVEWLHENVLPHL